MKDSKQGNQFDYMQFINWTFQSEQKLSGLDLFNHTQDLHCLNAQTKPSDKNIDAYKLKEPCSDNSQLPIIKEEQLEVDAAIQSTVAEKKIKNKVAAKQSRDRKKLYIDLLEKQTQALEKQLVQTNQQLEDCRAEILKNYFSCSQHIDGSFSRKMIHAYKKIKRLINLPQTQEQEDQLNFVIDSLCYRFGAMGIERQHSIKGAYNQIIKIGITIMARYIMWSARNQVHIFQENPLGCQNKESESWFKEMRLLLDSLPQREREIINRFKGALSSLEIQIRDVLGKLSKNQKKMKERCEQLDYSMTEIRQIMTPIQMAKFLVFQEHYRYWDDIRYHERIWLDECEDLGQPKKHFKLNEN